MIELEMIVSVHEPGKDEGAVDVHHHVRSSGTVVERENAAREANRARDSRIGDDPRIGESHRAPPHDGLSVSRPG
jgi:hypothetical protein